MKLNCKFLFVAIMSFFGFCHGQTIYDINGDSIKYRKIGNLYWTDNLETTSLWYDNSKLTKVTSAPMPDIDYGGGYIIDQNSKSIYSNRYFLNYADNYYYTWNTANNFTAFKDITSQIKKFNQIPNANVDVSNSSICPCGWRIPNIDDVSDLLLTTKVFNSKEEFKNWIYDNGLFDSRFMFNPKDAYAIKEDINPSTLENILFEANEFAGIFGIQGSDNYKPFKKNEMFSIWLSNIGASAGTDMQIDGLGMYIAKMNNKLNLVIKPFMASHMMTVKCVSDNNGLIKYDEWVRNQKNKIMEEKIIESTFDSLLMKNEFLLSYDYLKNKFKNDPPTIEKWSKSNEQMNDFFEAIGRGEIQKENGVNVYTFGKCDKYYECKSGRQENSLYCKGHNEKVKSLSLISLSSKLYNKWNNSFKNYVTELLNQKKLNESKTLIDFYLKKHIYINKLEEENQINIWNQKIAFIENENIVNQLKQKKLNQIESLFVGKWYFESKNIFMNNGEIYKMEEVWLVNSDRTYTYESRVRKLTENSFFNEYKEIGVYEIEEDSFGDKYVVAHILEEQGKSSLRIDKMKFDKIGEKKASRTIKFNEAKYPVKLVGKKM